VLYLANPCGNAAITAAMRAGHLGYIDTPKQGNTRPAGVLWCADNGSKGLARLRALVRLAGEERRRRRPLPIRDRAGRRREPLRHRRPVTAVAAADP
jgi:hypothetical protein